MKKVRYRGRIAPSPTGFLHLGHVATFFTAAERAREMGGTLIFRNEDIDIQRCRKIYADAAIEDLRWLGFEWQEGPDVGGPFAPYNQSERISFYLEIWKRLKAGGFIYPCSVSRKELQHATADAGEMDGEAIFPKYLRPSINAGDGIFSAEGTNWRFRVPDGEMICFEDKRRGKHCFLSGSDFGDFIIWRKDNVPSYELAVVADDHAMDISEVVRGEDLLLSTARQILIYRALNWDIPSFYHCSLVRDDCGKRLAKRYDSLSIRELRQAGKLPEEVLKLALHLRNALPE